MTRKTTAPAQGEAAALSDGATKAQSRPKPQDAFDCLAADIPREQWDAVLAGADGAPGADAAPPAPLLPSAIFGEQAARLVALQALHAIGRNLAALWKEACDGGHDGCGWTEDKEVDASFVLQIAMEECNRIRASTQTGADTHCVVSGIIRFASLVRAVHLLRGQHKDYSTRVLAALEREALAYCSLIEHVAVGARFQAVEG